MRSMLAVPSQFHREWIESHYVRTLEHALRDLRGEEIRVKLHVVAKKTDHSAPPLPAWPIAGGLDLGCGLRVAPQSPLSL